LKGMNERRAEVQEQGKSKPLTPPVERSGRESIKAD